MIINTDVIIKNLDGTKIPSDKDGEFTVGRAIGIILSSDREQKKFDALKAYILAQKFYSDKSVDIDKADLKSLTEILQGTKAYPPLVLGQLLLAIEEKKDADIPNK